MLIPRLQSPLVLVHGMCGQNQLLCRRTTTRKLFPGLPQFLQAAGNRVLVPRLSPLAGIRHRAAELKSFLDHHVGTEPVHMIGHSMGGLDARYAIAKLGLAARVHSLTTLSTPHRGSSFADWCMKYVEWWIRPLVRSWRAAQHALPDLTTRACRYFNEQIVDAPQVRYFSVTGRWDFQSSQMLWRLPHRIVFASEGPNDGLVSVQSAAYGEHLETWPGDHLSMINRRCGLWPRRCAMEDAVRGLFGRIVCRLYDEGF